MVGLYLFCLLEGVIADSTQLQSLIKINTEDILGALGLATLRRGRHLLAWLCRSAAQRFALQTIAYDQQVAEVGLAVAASALLQRMSNRLEVSGVENIPLTGPLFFLSNHPGLTDTIALFASIPRDDLRIFAADRPFLHELPHTSQYLIYLDESKGQNLHAVRQGITHLRKGGSLLTFPAGKIEPDPAILPGAVEALQSWSESVTLFTRLVPQTQVVPVLVSGVLNPQAQQSPLRYLRRSQKDREWLAAMLQILIPAYQPVTVHVDFGTPICGQSAKTNTQNNNSQLLHSVRKEMEALMESSALRKRTTKQ